MKKLLVSLLFVGGISGLSYAGQDDFGNDRPAIWRSSATSSSDNGVILATGAAILRSVVVAKSGTGSTLQLFNGSVSSGTAQVINSVIDTTAGKYIQYDLFYSSGLIYNNLGSTPAGIDIIWDYYITRNKPR